MTHPGANRYSMLDVSDAPEAPGIYAWYAAFYATEQDWQFKPGPGGDRAVAPFIELVFRYGSQFEPLAIQLAGYGAYGARWHGEVELDFPFAAKDSPDEHPEEDFDLNAADRELQRAVETPRARQIVTGILQRATPTFSTPLYVGVADNLRRRLTEHQKSYSKAAAWLRDHPEDGDKIRARGKSFGERAAARNIAMERLEAWVIDLESDLQEVPVDQLRDIAESAEWILHRIYSPILGRR